MPDRARDAKAALTWAHKIGSLRPPFPHRTYHLDFSSLPRPRTDAMVNWLSLAVPFAYLGVLIGSLATFSSLYRKRKARMLPPPLPRTPAPAASISERNETVVANVAYKLQKRRCRSNHGFLRISNETSTSPSFISSHPKITITKKRSRPRSRTRF